MTVLLPIAASTGATLTSLTVIVKVSKSVRLGVPLSVTATVDVVRRPRPGLSVGVQLKTPVAALMRQPRPERRVEAVGQRVGRQVGIGGAWR